MTIDHEQTLPDFLSNLIGQGIYDVSFTDELRRYGFGYDAKADILGWQGRQTKLGARSAEVALAEDDDSSIDPGRSGGDVFDALQLTQAILRLIAPNYPPPSVGMHNKSKAMKADLGLIKRTWRQN